MDSGTLIDQLVTDIENSATRPSAEEIVQRLNVIRAAVTGPIVLGGGESDGDRTPDGMPVSTVTVGDVDRVYGGTDDDEEP